jgi:murein DD-endopeptidase MepM/ murein hydrolase activator NlpD
MNTRLRHALLAPGLLAALVGSLTVTSLDASAGTSAPAALPLPPMHVKQGEVIRPLPLPWQAPVRGFRITGEFGSTGSNWSSTHTGLDFAVGYGSPIHAITSGVVTEAEYDGSYGNKTVITSGGGTEIWYCHQESLAVNPGQRVATGQVIGAVGMTGNTTGPHVHVEVHPGGGDPVDPTAVLEGHRVVL